MIVNSHWVEPIQILLYKKGKVCAFFCSTENKKIFFISLEVNSGLIISE